MKEIIKRLWKTDPREFLKILFLNIGAALTGGISIVMLVPMLDLLQVDLGSGGIMAALLRPFAGLTYGQRAAVLVSAFVVMILLKALFTRGAAVARNKFLEGYEKSLRKELYAAVMGADWQVLSTKKHAELVNLLITQCRQTKAAFQSTIGFLASAFSAVLQLTIAFCMSVPLTIMVLVVGAGFLWLFRPFQTKSRAYGKKAVEVNRSLYREIQNQLFSIKEIRAYGVEEDHAGEFDRISQESYDVSLQTVQLQVLPQFLYSVAAAVLVALAFLVSVVILDTGTAQLMVLVYVFSRIWPVFSSWQSQLQHIQSCLPAFDAVRDAVEELSQVKEEEDLAAEPIAFEEEIRFDRVSFTYWDGTEPVLDQVEFSLPAGSVTALAGRSGAGKSTTADLLLGLLHPTNGQILVDGVALTPEKLRVWRREIGYVPQEPLVLNDTIRENLLRFHPNATEEEMIEALKQSLAWPFVEKLEDGLDTVLGEKGLRISGGERQRIVLARVLMEVGS